MAESPALASLVPPPGGWTVEDLDALPESHLRYELTDGALTVSPSPSSLHQVLAAYLTVLLDERASAELSATQRVEIRFGRQLTRVPDVLVVRSVEPRRHWFAPSEVMLAVEIESPGSHVEDRATKPALYAQFGIPHYWRVEPDPLRITIGRLDAGDAYRVVAQGDRLTVDEPVTLDVPLTALLPRWARG